MTPIRLREQRVHQRPYLRDLHKLRESTGFACLSDDIEELSADMRVANRRRHLVRVGQRVRVRLRAAGTVPLSGEASAQLLVVI